MPCSTMLVFIQGLRLRRVMRKCLGNQESGRTMSNWNRSLVMIVSVKSFSTNKNGLAGVGSWPVLGTVPETPLNVTRWMWGLRTSPWMRFWREFHLAGYGMDCGLVLPGAGVRGGRPCLAINTSDRSISGGYLRIAPRITTPHNLPQSRTQAIINRSPAGVLQKTQRIYLSSWRRPTQIPSQSPRANPLSVL